jgi:hypothetical protein
MVPTGTADEALMKLMDGGEKGVTTTVGILLRALTNGLKVAKECIEARDFTAPESLDGLQRWGEDARNRARFRVARATKLVTFVMDEDRSRAAVRLDWPTSPSLAQWEDVVASGATLGRLIEEDRHRASRTQVAENSGTSG